ncbi:calcineurin-like phosphoesterase domain-containing protein [Ditylenchus destructor]|uniref:Purple acid phosphatase n=1 Tax=Ditylenchus destructor TaxID=166010 RepID=A0AAD4NJQ0_9BILA|nr:calcineurin-like phosphoesterase domain-containing protein [Ditylenchus destructor]
MDKQFLSLFFVALLNYVSPQSRKRYYPEQIHIAPGSEPNSMTVVWVTLDKAPQTLIRFGRETNRGKLKYWTAVGKKTLFQYGKNWFYVHYAVMRKLDPVSQYKYRVGSDAGWSAIYSFNTLPSAGFNESFSMCIFGDLAAGPKGVLTPYLIDAAREQKFNLIMHTGDIGYDFHRARKGNQFMNELQEVFAQVPYLIVVGNHEREPGRSDFYNIRQRFRMPNSVDDSNQFYSFDVGPVHFVVINTELYYSRDNARDARTQFAWLIDDLQRARLNFATTPWIVVFQHRPFTCSSGKTDRCPISGNDRLRSGAYGVPGPELAYTQFSVDLVFSGHEHLYERFNPMRVTTSDTMIFDAQNEHQIHNSEGPIHITTGVAGSPHSLHHFRSIPIPGSIVRIREYGYTLLTVESSNRLKIEQIAVKRNNEVVDSLTLTKSLL